MDVSMVALKGDLDGVTITGVDGGYLIRWDEWVLETTTEFRGATATVAEPKTSRRRISKTAVRERIDKALGLIADVLKSDRVTDQRDAAEKTA